MHLCDPPRLDVRPEPAFASGHDRGAAHIPLEALRDRSWELPADPGSPIAVLDDDPARRERAVALLHEMGFAAAHPAPEPADGARRATGRATARLWRPTPFLEGSLPRIREELGEGARAIDLAAGSGRDAVFLAAEGGLHVEAIDHLPSARERARALAARWGVTDRVRARDVDLEAPGTDLGEARADLVTCFRFLFRPLFPAIVRLVRPGGLVCYQTFDVRERDRSGKPSSPKHLLEPGELRRAFEGLEVIEARERVEPEGRFFQSLLARRPMKDGEGRSP